MEEDFTGGKRHKVSEEGGRSNVRTEDPPPAQEEAWQCCGSRKEFGSFRGYSQHTNKSLRTFCTASQGVPLHFADNRSRAAGAEGGATSSSARRQAPRSDDLFQHHDDDIYAEGDRAPDDMDPSAQDAPIPPTQPAGPAWVWKNRDNYKHWLSKNAYSSWKAEDWQNYAIMQWGLLNHAEQEHAEKLRTHVWDQLAFDACMLAVQDNTKLKPHQWNCCMLSEWGRRCELRDVLDTSCAKLRLDSLKLVDVRVRPDQAGSNSSLSWHTMLTSGTGLVERLALCTKQRWTSSRDAEILQTHPPQGHLPRVARMKDLSKVFKNYSRAAMAMFVAKTDISIRSINKLLSMLADHRFFAEDVKVKSADSLFKCMRTTGILVEVVQVDMTQPCDNRPVILYHVESFKALHQVIVQPQPPPQIML